MMKVASVVALVLCLSAGGAFADERDAKNRPISKVVTLLKDMVGQLQKEADEDNDTYEAFGCWCETNDKEKTKSIKDAGERIEALQAAVESLTANSARLNTEIVNLDKEIADNNAALSAATALRTKQMAEFKQEELDMLQSISSLKAAVQVIGKTNGGALLQESGGSTEAETDITDIAVTLRSLLRKHKALLEEVISPKQSHIMDSFVQAPDTYFLDATVKTKASYAPQGGEVFGILKQMKETFETNLALSQKEEAENQQAYDDLKAAKTSEIDAGNTAVETKTAELASTDEKCAQSKEDTDDTRETLEADQKFLTDLKERCANMDAEFEQRTKTRQLEITAVSKALEFLSSDEASDLFASTLTPSMLQVKSSHRDAAVKVLEQYAKRFHSPQLSALAVKARLDKFGKVKETLEGMIEKLMKEKDDDIKQKDFCIDSFNQNERETSSKEREKTDALALIDDLQMSIDTLNKAIEQLKAEIADAQVQMKRAGEDREKANKDFQLTVADQRATQKLLTAALNVLKGFYEKGQLLQTQEVAGKQPAGPPPPAGFSGYKKAGGGGGGVTGLIEIIIDDAKAMEAEAIQGEEDSQKTYEAFVVDTNASVEEKTKDVIAKTEIKAKADEDKVKEEVHRDNVLGDLEQLNQESQDLHRSCDFLMKNFEVRATARDEEVEALKQGIAMFSGASFGAFLERTH